LLDEWSSIPIELQPYLADLLRRAVFPIGDITVKIAAIEHRSHFQLRGPNRDYIGIELGADASADLNLDDFMVFDNDAERAKNFFRELLFRHVRSVMPDGTAPSTAKQLLQLAFTQHNSFDEFVRAAEGVPRDAINIIALAAQRAADQPLSIDHIRAAAATWYKRDKGAAVSANQRADMLLHWIVEEVIGNRKARAFLLRSDTAHVLIRLIEDLFDARVLHVLKKSISGRDQPGVRYNVYKLDYGCYVDLMTTVKAPLGLLLGATDNGDLIYVDVPPDDYRSIRRAILELEAFEARLPEQLPPKADPPPGE
jgi:hypothetical protein